MTSDMNIIKPGLLTTVQDLGRSGYQSIGMSVAGAMDEFSLRMANLLVGNEEGEACLEMTYLGCQIEFKSKEVIAITGADMDPKLNGKEIQMWQAQAVYPGDKLEFGPARSGMRTYISFSRKLDIKDLMGSKSTFLKAGIGGYEGRALKAGDTLSLSEDKPTKLGYKLDQTQIPRYRIKENIRVVYGPQDDYFTSEAKETFENSTYKISQEADRMGYRLKGEKIGHDSRGADIISDGINFGSIQVPASGQPIIMMADRQTTGGYTKIAGVIRQDLTKLAQMGPAKEISFEPISIDEAHRLYIDYENYLKDIKSKLIDISSSL